MAIALEELFLWAIVVMDLVESAKLDLLDQLLLSAKLVSSILGKWNVS